MGQNMGNYESNKDNQKTLAELMNYIPGGIMTLSSKSNENGFYHITYCSEGVAALVGRSVSEFLDMYENKIAELIFPGDIDNLIRQTQESVNNLTPMEAVYRVFHKNGEIIWINQNNNVVVNDQGEKIIVAVFQNISQETRLYRDIIDFSDSIIQVINMETHEVYYANEVAMALAGSRDYEGRKCYEYFMHNDEVCGHCNYKDGIAHTVDVPVPELGRIMHATGKIIDWHGKKVIIEYVSDITKYKQNEEAYKRYMDSLVNTTPDALSIFRLNITENICYKGTSSHKELLALQSTGTVDGYVQQAMSFIHDKEEQAQFTAKFSRESLLEAFKKGIRLVNMRHNCHIPNKKSMVLETRVNMVINPSNGAIEGIVFTRDITSQVLDEIIHGQLLNKQYDCVKLINVVDTMTEIRIGTLPELAKYVGVSAPYEQLFHAAANDFIHPDERTVFLKRAALDNIISKINSLGVYTFTARCVFGAQERLDKFTYHYLNPEKNIIILTMENVTELFAQETAQKLELEKALTAANKASAAKSDFLSNMSHEIRTPMNAIIGMTKLAQLEPNLSPEVTEYLHEIDTSSKYLLGVINDILDMSKIESGRFELDYQWVTIQDVLKPCIDIIEPAMKAKNIHFSSNLAQFPVKIQGLVDVEKTQRMYMNILNNACKFTGEGGTVTLTCKQISSEGNKNVDEITITDTGCGMTKEFMDKIFEPFVQERNIYSGSVKGTGLGLSIARHIARAIGGDITVSSQVGVGSTFVVTFPYEFRIVDEGPVAKEESQNHEDIDLQGLHILLAEDHPLNATIARKLLENKGVTVTVAEDGSEAVECFKKSPVNHFNCILMDIRMPKMNGMEATKEIRALDRADAKTVPILAMTANAFAEDREQSMKAGMNAHLSKPIDPDIMYETIKQFC